MDHKPLGGVSVHRSLSQMPMVKAMTIIVDSLLSWLKLDCDVGYDAVVKGVSVVMYSAYKTIDEVGNMILWYGVFMVLES